MTKDEILNALEGLKELTNDNGKREIDSIKAGIAQWVLVENKPVESWEMLAETLDTIENPPPAHEVIEEAPKQKRKPYKRRSS